MRGDAHYAGRVEKYKKMGTVSRIIKNKGIS